MGKVGTSNQNHTISLKRLQRVVENNNILVRIAQWYVVVSLYLQSTTISMQRFLDLFISINRSTCFRRFLPPSSGAQNCTYEGNP